MASDDQIAQVLGEFPQIAAAWLFGSMARRDATLNSDVDLAILFKRRGDTALDHERELRTLAARLEALWPGRSIDLVVIESQGPILAHRILEEGRLVYDAAPERRIDFESDTYVRYFDFRPTYDLAARHAVAGFRRRLEDGP